jgi:hypothetical protein
MGGGTSSSLPPLGEAGAVTVVGERERGRVGDGVQERIRGREKREVP